MTVLTPQSQRPSTPTALGNHEQRIRALERRPPGTWVYAGTYPGDLDTTPDSEPFQNGVLNAGSGKQRFRYRRTNENQTEFAGVITIPAGLDVAGTVIIQLTDPIYQPLEDIPGPGITNAMPCEWLFRSNGELVFNGYLCCGASGDIPNLVWNEIPTGAINGINDTFTLADTPDPAGSLMLFKNGLLMMQGGGGDYGLSTATVVFVASQIPSTGDVLVATYQAGTL